jgi:hypothetical protein
VKWRRVRSQKLPSRIGWSRLGPSGEREFGLSVWHRLQASSTKLHGDYKGLADTDDDPAASPARGFTLIAEPSAAR